MSGDTITKAVEQRGASPAALVEQYRDHFAQVMPSHVRPDTWVRLAVGVLRKDGKLLAAAQASPDTLMVALATAARLGLEPGTEQFYLTPRKRKGQPEVQGIVGYQGIVELIYRAGHAASVTVEVVREHDDFVWTPGAIDHEQLPRWAGHQTRPFHRADWFGQRGDLVGVYAYADMRDGATSKVVVLGRDHIARAKAKSDGADGPYSPWRTDEEAMWLKTAARRLAKWVPTSSEIRPPVVHQAATVTVEQTDTVEVLDGELLDD
ncbi:recombinase RecT [Streptomyces sp. N35]|uniref:recombinase RecT n=1 Tax=Streptomyces sp. N35 TaxID=2795730 RepID=UPI0018F3A3E1|nr:recombinase RecT [Streptomyces sp. N35]